MRSIAIAIAGLALGVGCTERVQLVGSDAGALPGLVSLDVTPPTTQIAIVDTSAPAQSIVLAATGHFADGSSRDISADVAWTVDNPAPGGFLVPGTYTTTNAAGGHVTVHATSGDIAGTATITVVVTETIIDGTFPPPAGADGLLGASTPVVTDPQHSPTIAYPSDGTMFPQGLAPILFQWQTGAGNNAYRLSFDSDVLHVTVLTGGDRWQPDSTIWSLLALSSGGGSIATTLAGGATATPTTLYGATPVQLRFSSGTPGGLIYYWTQTGSVVMRGALAQPSATQLYPTRGDTTCVGCHAVSRDGSTMALGYGGETLQSFDIETVATGISASAKIGMGWATFSPDGSRLLVADKGVLALYDAASGAPIGGGNGVVPLPPGMLATHPDWSPDGGSIAVSIMMSGDNMNTMGGQIARIPYSNGVFGAPEILVATGAPMDNNYYPRWSPDGRWLAYVYASGASKGAPTAELRLVAATGGTPIALRLANHRVSSVDDVPNLADTMPTWAPITTDVAWLAFATQRAYGVVSPGAGADQIWIAAVDLQAAGTGSDPSYAAFWLPCQSITTLDNNPIWSVETAPP